MNRNLHSPSSLTEFARDFEEPENLLTNMLNKLANVYNTSYNTVNDIHTNTNNMISSPSQVNTASNTILASRICSTSLQSDIGLGQYSSIPLMDDQNDGNHRSEESTSYSPDGRTMINVLRRISKIVASRTDNLRNYKDTELHQFWMPDDKAKACYDCSQKFSTFRRKHHCRLCGQIFCSKCCSQLVPGKIIMCSGDLKVCTYCSKIVLSYLKSPDIKLDLKADLQALQNDLSIKLSLKKEENEYLLKPIESIHRKISLGYQEECFISNQNQSLSSEEKKKILQHSNSLKTLYEEMFKILPEQNCGTDLVSCLISHQKSSNKTQAIAILTAMVAAGFLIPIVLDPDQYEFEETLHYKFVSKCKIKKCTASQQDLNIVCNSKNISSSVSDDNDFLCEENFPPKSLEGSVSYQSIKTIDVDNSIRSATRITKELLKSYCEHEELLLSQLLRTENLDQSWINVLIPLCAGTVNKFRHGFCTNDLMDIRNYVSFKKVPGGLRNDCSIIDGVVFTKNVAHKEMSRRIEHPKILLLQCAIIYERVEGKFISIETLLLQEQEYLRNVTARILSFKPNIVLVHKNVAGIAQAMLRENGITLVLDVKLSVVERLSKCMQCDIVTSIESNIGTPKLGSCDVFHIQHFNDDHGSYKTLMFFEMYSCPRSFSFLLRGGKIMELARVKKVASILLYARYNWRLEMAFLLDAFAQPPSIYSVNSKLGNQLSLDQYEHESIQHHKQYDTSTKGQSKNSLNIVDKSAFTDPLRTPNEMHLKLCTQKHCGYNFKIALRSTTLSVSPYVKFPLPYLETEVGKKCYLRKHFPVDLYFSKQFTHRMDNFINEERKILDKGESKLKPYHTFVTHLITSPVDSHDLQTIVAEFRALGGRFQSSSKMFIFRGTTWKPQKVLEDYLYKDALDLRNHQRLQVLFCSYYHNPKTTSSFCAQPTLLDMKFYGQHDIMLGQFLQRYCFRSYICQSCNLPMMDHVRRYVHSIGCVQVELSEDTSEGVDDNIFLTSWCTICTEVTPSVQISHDTWCLSFAKYLELRFHAHAYKKRAENGVETDISELERLKCSHSLHKHYIHYFSSKGIGARFTYSSIGIWEINLPPLFIKFPESGFRVKSQVQEEIRKFSEMGHEVYSKILCRIPEIVPEHELSTLKIVQSILNRDQLIFKQHVEVIYTLLMDESITSTVISDAILRAKCALSESIELWGPRLNETALQTKFNQKQEQCTHIEDGAVCTEKLKVDFDSQTVAHRANKQYFESTLKQLNKMKHSTSEQICDKKAIKQLLIQLLPSSSSISHLQSPFLASEHYTLPLGEFPILVNDQDFSSVIAYCLASPDYRNSIDNMHFYRGSYSDAENSPNTKRNSQDWPIDNDDQDTIRLEDDKKTRLRSHLELQFQDLTTQFVCKIYFAEEFDAIRTTILNAPKQNNKSFEIDDTVQQRENDANKDADISQVRENSNNVRISFARSLHKSIQWDARGGKSGSNFTKTLDDRFILKEMTKGDVSIFENFAPYYFDYIEKCLQKEKPTLLAKILGVFRITIKKKEYLQEKSLLVMENLFYGCDIQNKFDLKGSERNRLVNTENQNGEIVLLDENLINMSWSKPLYILSHSKKVLREAINRDTSFLERNSVMDYSLLVGLNSTANILVLGIIDYIRTFTFDKRIESLVKQTGILGGQGKLPTVIAPQRYKQRFTEAMERYFHSVPDRWEGLSKN